MSPPATTDPAGPPRRLRFSGRGLLGRALAIVGVLVVVSGIVATYLREEVVEQEAFVTHATRALQTPEVGDLVAEQVITQLVDEGGTDLITARPLVRPIVEALVTSETFRDLFEVAARDTHRLLFTRDDDVSFAVADAGTLAVAALRSASPGLGNRLPAVLDVDVVAIRDGTLLAGLVRAGDRVKTLALVLPPVGLLLILSGIALARDPRAALVRSGLALAVVCGLLIAGLAFWRSSLASGAVAPGQLADADVRAAVSAAWGIFFNPLRDWLLAVGVAGMLVAGLAAGRVTATSASERFAALARRIARPLSGPVHRTARGMVFLVLGGLLLWQPFGLVPLAALLLGGILVYLGTGELLELIPERIRAAMPAGTGRGPVAARRSRGWTPWITAAMVLLVGIAGAGAIVGASVPSGERASLEPASPEQATAVGCNGSRALCDRRLDQVVFPGTHNSFSAALEPGWLFANQRVGIEDQLEAGIRLLMLDPHHGVDDGEGRVRTDLEADGTSRNRVAAELSRDALRAAERLGGRVGLGSLSGRRGVYLCHSLCELGSESFVAQLDVLHDFLNRRPGEIVVVHLEPSVSPGLVAAAFRRANLLDTLAVLDPQEPMPTLGELLRQGDRVIVLTERNGGAYDWYHPAYDIVQDTPLGARKAGEFSCAPNRGDSSRPLFMMNHWIDRFPPPRSENARASTRRALLDRVAHCEEVRGRTVNLIATDFFDDGAVVEVARELNAREPEPSGSAAQGTDADRRSRG